MGVLVFLNSYSLLLVKYVALLESRSLVLFMTGSSNVVQTLR